MSLSTHFTLMNIGDQVPDLKLPASNGEQVSLKDFEGKYIVLYIYPKDDTPGCTKQACAFRDTHKDFEDLNAVIIGLSKDGESSHEKFINKYELPFLLLSDENLELMKVFGAWKEKSMYGRTFLGVQRSTFLIDPQGKVVHIWPKVRVAGHIEKVLEELKSITQN